MLSTSRFCCLTILIITVVASASMAQEWVNLPVKPERLRKAQKAEQEAIKRGDLAQLAEAWYLFGKTYGFAGDYQSSQKYFLKSLRILEPRGSSFKLSRLYVRLSENEGKQGHLMASLNYAKQSMQVARQAHSEDALILAYGALGQAYENLREIHAPAGQEVSTGTIINYYRQIESLGHKLRDTIAVAEALLRQGTFLASNNDPEAIPPLLKARELFTLNNKPIGRLNTTLHLASAYISLGQFEKARLLLEQAEEACKKQNRQEYDVLMLLDKETMRYFELTGQWQKAYAWSKKSYELEKKQLLSDHDGNVARLNIEYETDKKEMLLRSQRRELDLQTASLAAKERSRLTLLVLFFGMAVMSALFFWLYRKNRRISQDNQNLVKEQNHRVKNNLQVISSLLNMQAKRLTDETARQAVIESRLRVQSMAIVHRRLYDGVQLAQVALDEFIPELVTEILRTYGYETVKTGFGIEPITLSADKATRLGLILNELTTNACKYAFPDHKAPCYLVQCASQKQLIELTVIDNGPGFDSVGTGQAQQSRSFGMQLIQSQVEQLQGTARFENLNKGTQFTLTFHC